MIQNPLLRMKVLKLLPAEEYKENQNEQSPESFANTEVNSVFQSEYRR